MSADFPPALQNFQESIEYKGFARCFRMAKKNPLSNKAFTQFSKNAGPCVKIAWLEELWEPFQLFVIIDDIKNLIKTRIGWCLTCKAKNSRKWCQDFRKSPFDMSVFYQSLGCHELIMRPPVRVRKKPPPVSG